MQDLPSLDVVKLEKIADASFLELALRAGIDTNPGNFASLSVKAMKLLQSQGKTNLVYRFPYVIATAHPESDESLLPLNRMPFGLIEYQIDFFSSTNISQVSFTTPVVLICITVILCI